MKSIEITVKTHHLRGNSYLNRDIARNQNRDCPLYEALKEEGHEVSRVGMVDLDIGERLYKIDFSIWNPESVESLIQLANSGQEVEKTLVLNEINR